MSVLLNGPPDQLSQFPVTQQAVVIKAIAAPCWGIIDGEKYHGKAASAALSWSGFELVKVSYQADAATVTLAELVAARLDAVVPQSVPAAGVMGAAGVALEGACPLLSCLVHLFGNILKPLDNPRRLPQQLGQRNEHFVTRAIQLLLRAATVARQMTSPVPSLPLVKELAQALTITPVLFDMALPNATDTGKPVNATADMAVLLAPLLPQVPDV